MAHFKKLVEKENVGKLVYGDNIVDEIVDIAVSEVPYVDLFDFGDSISVNFDKDGVHISVLVKIHYTQSVSDIAFKIQETVRHNVETMTEYHVASVNVYVKDVVFDDSLIPVVVETTETESEPESTKNY